MTEKDMGIYMEDERLANFARNTAATVDASGRVPGRRAAREVRQCLRRLELRMKSSSGTGAAAEWFSDNWYIAQREGKSAASELEASGRLPGAPGGRAAVMEAAGALVRAGRGEVTGERVKLFLTQLQKVRPLTEGELAAFIPALRAELVSFLDELYPRSLDKIRDDGELAGTTGRVFTSLRLLSSVDFSPVLEEVNLMEAALRRDPAGIYPLMDEETRSYYRERLSKLAAASGMTGAAAAEQCLKLAEAGPERHVGYYILEKPLGGERRPRRGGLYMGMTVLATLFFTLLIGMGTGSVLAAALALVPISELVKNVTDFALLRIVRPRRLPRMELEGGIPRVGRTVCVISALLTGEEDGRRYAKLMEEYRLLNRDAGEELLFGILADLPEHGEAAAREDRRILESAGDAVEELNRRYGGGFYLFARPRELNAADGVWMGRERKRGAIEDLVRLISGDRTSLRVLAGEEGRVRGCAYILTLDADTRLTAGSARELVGAALHPLNVPVVDEKSGRVVSGYGVFEPRVAVDLAAAGRSDFAKIYAGEGGIDPYNSVTSDLYQDIFAEGTFMGKGLINVPVYRRLLDGRFPDNAVLSHDILEGAYLRCAFVSDTELTDGWPFKVTSYFARQERWIRGDWQNLRWCTRRVRTRDGALVKNPISSLNRWKIADNLRRSLLPPLALAGILAGAVLSGPGLGLCAALGVLALASPLVLTCAELLVRHDGSGRARYQSGVISGAAGVMLRTAVRLLLLPAEAWVSVRAAATALWRMLVTKKRLLAWVTSSEAERRHGNTLAVNYRRLLACPILGALALIPVRTPLLAAAGILWLFTPAYAWALSRQIRPHSAVTRSDRAYLMERAGEIWRFFRENLTGEDNYLPPDNVQTEPDLGRAHRTSPTNIGLALLSCAAAADLGLISESEAAELAERTIGTVEKLTKWNGHLLNWYDTRTLQPMEPRYVSTVDSGNLMGCLLAAEQWLRGIGREELASRCEALAAGCDLRPLFDGRRKLFHIGFDLSKNALTEGWYDLLASEARLTSYVAVALGQVPRKHWRRLGRALVSLDRYSGMASWTGTMFEYLMPNLLLPCPENSLIRESSDFCLYVQRRAFPGIPWGISESAYYAFDPGLAYRYKAHGAQRLALKRGMDLERVISPYSTYLALPLDTPGAVRNLRRLEDAGLMGRYGLYEAVDYTPGRAAPGRGEIVRTFMAHHLGMSLIAISNALCGGVFQRRFMSDRRMGAYRELLEERLPAGRLILRQPPREIPEKPHRAEGGGYREELMETDALEPRCVPLSNGVYTLIFSEVGKTRALWRGLDVTAFDPDPEGPGGMAIYLRAAGTTIPLTPWPEYEEDTEYRAALTDSYGRIRAKKGRVSTTLTVTVPPSGAGELRRVEISAPAEETKAELLCVLEPVLQRRGDYLSHPAFSRLALEASFSSNVLTIRRRPRPGEGEVCLSLTAGGEMRVTTHRRRGDEYTSGELLRLSPDMVVAASLPVKLTAGRGEVFIALSAGEDPEETALAARRALETGDTPAISRVAAASLMLGLRQASVRAAVARTGALIFGAPYGQARREAIDGGSFSRESLWEYGISGDLPVVAGKISSQSDLEAASELTLEHALLAENGVEADLALLITDGGDYRSAQREAVLSALRRAGREGTVGRPGGVALIDWTQRAEDCLRAMASQFVRLDAIPAQSAHRRRVYPREERYLRGSEPVRYGFTGEGTFRFLTTDTLPGAGWSQVLTSGSFGAIMTETGAGYMWSGNSRLMKLTPAPTGGLEPERSETLRLLLPDGTGRSLFADGSGPATAVEYGFGFARWERDLGQIKTRVTAFVPESPDCRVMIVELEGAPEGAELQWCLRLSMGESNTPDPALRVLREGGCLTAAAPGGPFKGTRFRVLSDPEPSGFTCDHDAFRMGQLNGEQGSFLRPCAALSVTAGSRTVLVCGCAPEDSLRRAARSAQELFVGTAELWRGRVARLAVKTGVPRVDAYTSGWAGYQIWAGRVLARTGLYQNGGAVGFRDQLQDVCALIPADPGPARRQICLAASRQYLEGDVMHWWHDTPSGPMGVRTRCSDDLLWLPWALCDYVRQTGDLSVCRERAAFLKSPELSEEERDRYERPGAADEASILDHALRAAERFISRGSGAHGLALILAGDWNDGFDRLGVRGRGESVWLTFFGSMVLRDLGELCRAQGDTENSDKLLRKSKELLRAGEGAWTGRWYLRAYDDEGRAIGAPGCPECEIDSLPQSFAFFAGADRDRVREALSAAFERLYDSASGTVKLFDPPFDRGRAEPGYIRTYGPGFRENGGQYTHAAAWLALALIESGSRDRGLELLSAISPWGRDNDRYLTEPYAVTADVYTAPGHLGRGGWSWYTGSAGWFLRASRAAGDRCLPAGAVK